MIHIKKQKDNPNISVYTKIRWKGVDGVKTTLAKRDLDKAIAHYSDENNYKDNKKLTRKSFKYEAYSHKDTKNELKKIFNSKCAYCESYIAHIEPGDIEHFRPKAEVHTKEGKELVPGYYWLGAEWNNLLLSCIKCNRSNNEPVNVEDGIIQNMGKANHFPLSDESIRVRNHEDDYTVEKDFVEIINPCEDRPEDHLDFLENGQIRPKDMKGELSIKVYGLFRADLVKQRKKTCRALHLNLIDLITDIQELEEAISNDKPQDRVISRLKLRKEQLDTAFNEDAEYLGMKRQKLAHFLNSNPLSNQRLQTYGLDLNKYLK